MKSRRLAKRTGSPSFLTTRGPSGRFLRAREGTWRGLGSSRAFPRYSERGCVLTELVPEMLAVIEEGHAPGFVMRLGEPQPSEMRVGARAGAGSLDPVASWMQNSAASGDRFRGCPSVCSSVLAVIPPILLSGCRTKGTLCALEELGY